VRLSLSLLCLAALMGCVSMEWRGSMIPHFGIKGKEQSRDNQPEEKRSRLRSVSVDWSQFRGPTRKGIAPVQGVALNWGSPPVLRWKVSAGEGHSSIITYGQSVITMEQDGQEELVIARSLDDGKTLWKQAVQTRWGDFMSGVGPRSTPTLHAGKLFALFTDGSLVCLEADSGKRLWETKIVGDEHEFPEWGISCSPLVWNDLVIVSPGGEKGAASAYQAETGKLIWRSDFHGKGVYLSPIIIDLLGAKHLIVGAVGKIAGLDPATGETQWEKPWKIFLNNAQIAQPLALSNDSFLLSAGYGKGAECLTVTHGSGELYAIDTAWKSKNLKSKFSNPVLKDGFIYGFNENSFTCLDASDGKLKWRGSKYGYGRVLLVDDKLVILGNTGILSVVEANPKKFVEIYSGQLLSNARCWNGPALVGGYLLARNGDEIACFDWAKR
jgi:outer membrane protein assembly factor BamB